MENIFHIQILTLVFKLCTCYSVIMLCCPFDECDMEFADIAAYAFWKIVKIVIMDEFTIFSPYRSSSGRKRSGDKKTIAKPTRRALRHHQTYGPTNGLHCCASGESIYFVAARRIFAIDVRHSAGRTPKSRQNICQWGNFIH